MGFAAASAYLLSTLDERRSQHDLGRLDRMELLLKELGDPQLAFPTIHVGGTSGKGSTATMIASALTASGLKCGLHTKPHLSSMTERMRINHRVIYEDRFAVLLSLIRPVLDEMALTDLRPTYFETLLALALVHFAEEKVDVAVIEVGLGGRLDGTNLIAPAVSVITNVGLDHQDVLGDTVELIAADKAGIAKRGVPLISDANGGARTVIETICREVEAPFISVADTVRIQSLSETAQGQHFTIATPNADYDIGTHVVGTFQQRNAATAIVALEHLPSGLRPGKTDIEDGFTNLVLAGRMEVLIAHPSVIFDVAHNPDIIRSLVQSLLQLFPDRRFHFVIAHFRYQRYYRHHGGT